MTEKLTWADPPHHGYDWAEIATMLRSRPNEWLRIFEDGPVSIVNAIRQERINALSPSYRRPGNGPGFQVRTRNNTMTRPRRCSLYLRWVDEQGEANDRAAPLAGQ